MDDVRTRGVVVLQSPNYGVELSAGLTEQLLAAGVPLYLDPVRLLSGTGLPITGGGDELTLELPRPDSYGFEPPAEAYGLIIDVATGLPAVFGMRNQTRVYLADRDSGRIVSFVGGDGLRDDDDAARVLRELLGGASAGQR